MDEDVCGVTWEARWVCDKMDTLCAAVVEGVCCGGSILQALHRTVHLGMEQ